MIDLFVQTNKPITDIQKALSGFGDEWETARVRDGGPTQFWRQTTHGWVQDEHSGMTVYEHLTRRMFELCAYRGVWPMSGEFGVLRLKIPEALEWLTTMTHHRYAVEDAICCTVDASVEEDQVACAMVRFQIEQFRAIHQNDQFKQALSEKLLTWTDRAVEAGADEIAAFIALEK